MSEISFLKIVLSVYVCVFVCVCALLHNIEKLLNKVQ